MIYLRLFFEFCKVGLFAVGGGLATIPFLSDLGSRTGWFTSGQLADMIAVSESTPGPIGVNMATYAGYTAAGVPGGIISTLGLVFPSLIIILIMNHKDIIQYLCLKIRIIFMATFHIPEHLWVC